MMSYFSCSVDFTTIVAIGNKAWAELEKVATYIPHHVACAVVFTWFKRWYGLDWHLAVDVQQLLRS